MWRQGPYMVKGPQLQRVYTWINGLLSDPAPQLISVEDIGAVSGLLCAAFCFLYCAGRRSCFPVIVWLLLSLSLSPLSLSLIFPTWIFRLAGSSRQRSTVQPCCLNSPGLLFLRCVMWNTLGETKCFTTHCFLTRLCLTVFCVCFISGHFSKWQKKRGFGVKSW